MLQNGTKPDYLIINPCKTGYFVICSTRDAIFAGDFQTQEEYSAVTEALKICGEDWVGNISVDDNSRWKEESEPVLFFEFI